MRCFLLIVATTFVLQGHLATPDRTFSALPGGGKAAKLAFEAGYSPECQNKVVRWQTWNGGLTCGILVKDAGEPSMSSWTVTILLDRDLDTFKAYDTDLVQVKGRTYRINPLISNQELSDSTSKILDIQIGWPQGTPEPKILSLSINGETFTCSIPADDMTDATNPPEIVVPPPNTTEDASIPIQPREVGVFVPLPKKVMGMYVLLADEKVPGFEGFVDWQPELYPYQQQGANVLFFTFIHPGDMTVPRAFANLAATRGKSVSGGVSGDTVILFAIGGYGYSQIVKPWPWLTSRENAEEMAARVAKWPEMYGCDGIDLDIEEGAGDMPGAGENMVFFVKKLRELQPKMIVGQPTYGYPQIQAEIDVINASWDEKGNYKGVADTIGLMVYDGTNSLNYVQNYVSGTSQWEGFPIKVNAPSTVVLLGAKGNNSPDVIATLVDACLREDYLGIMVWYASVRNGLKYDISYDASESTLAQQAFEDGLNKFQEKNDRGYRNP